MTTIRMFEAFAGYGSQLLAMRRLERDFPNEIKVVPVGFSEIEPTAIKAYHALHGEDVPNFGDICTIDWSQVPDFDLLTYSFPCTDISAAGVQQGLKKGSNTRSSLLWECERAIEQKRPCYLLMENVKALVQRKFINDFHDWLRMLESYGYSNFWEILNAKDFGIPQNRERVFCVSVLKTAANPDPRFYFPKPFALDKRLADVLDDNVDESFFLRDEMLSRFCVKSVEQEGHPESAEEIPFDDEDEL